MPDILFPILYLAGLVLGSTIRVWYSRKFNQDKRAIYRREGLLVLVLAYLWGIAQALLIHNWIAGVASLAIFLPLYLLRVPREEKVMLNEFGDEYREYMKRTGRVIPRFWR